MENQLQVSNHNLSTPLNRKELEIAEIIWHVNLLMNFPLTDIQIESWSRSINELRPEQDLSKLIAVINMMKIGSIEFNSRKGIQNIFVALKEYDKIKIGYVVKTEQSRFVDQGNFTSTEKKIFYCEDDSYPENMIWLVDKEKYLSFHLSPSNPQTDDFFSDL